MKIGIVGAGWYGCHIGSKLLDMGVDVVIFEKENQIFSKASGNNQFRLHQGFHYARNFRTRVQSKVGFDEFIDIYPKLSTRVERNYYVVPKWDSNIDFKTYMMIMMSSGIEFQRLKRIPKYLSNVEGILQVDERLIETKHARDFFNKKLGPHIRLGSQVNEIKESSKYIEINFERFDYLIDCTWGHLKNKTLYGFYEPTILLNYKAMQSNFPALTFVDGPLMSIYPTDEKDVFTLSSVKHTPLGQFDNAKAAMLRVNGINISEIKSKIFEMEREICKYIPDFKNMFEYISPQLSVKTKLIGIDDDRSCYVDKRGRVITVMSGKIDTIFYASERINQLITA